LYRKEIKVEYEDELIRLLKRIDKKLDNDEQSRQTARKQTSVARSSW